MLRNKTAKQIAIETERKKLEEALLRECQKVLDKVETSKTKEEALKDFKDQYNVTF